jgi:hypothetical protein
MKQRENRKISNIFLNEKRTDRKQRESGVIKKIDRIRTFKIIHICRKK